MPKPKTFYVTRDQTDPFDDAVISASGRLRKKDGLLYSKDRLVDLCYSNFEKTTGLTLKPGETKKVQLVEVKP